MRWSGHIFAPPPPQLDCAPGSSGRWLAALGRAAWRRCGEEGSRDIADTDTGDWRLETAGAVFWVKARVLSPVSADCQLLLSGFIILEIMHRHAAGGGAQAWPGLAGVTIALERNQHWDRERERMSLSASCQTCDKTSTSRTHLIRHTAAGASKLLRGAVYDHYHRINANIT